ncbi:hypothetical protein [Actinomadura sp. B10D3]|uniref:hypothetical protein n=1 Tax=Actinomadura sp. B10D3 TaxID=3153557 RepID=UPI00325DE462
MRKISAALVAALMSATLVLGLTACGGKEKDRWCERDATDTRVSSSYCEDGVPGYEWETDDDGHSSHNKHKKNGKNKKYTFKHRSSRR